MKGLEKTTIKAANVGLAALLALGLFTSPLPAQVQERKKLFRVGVLSNSASPSRPHYIAFVQGLRELGYVEGKNLTIEIRSTQGRLERASGLAAELVSLGVDVIVAPGAEANLRAARQATRAIPIVMVAVDYNPLEQGYVAGLSRPGGNITGLVFQQVELTAKRLELLKETVPAATRIAVFWDVISADQLPAAETAANALGVTLLPTELRQPPYDFPGAFRDIEQAGAEALVVLMSPLMRKPDRARLPNLALQHRLPTIFGVPSYVAAGGLMSYGAKLEDVFRRATYYVDRILQGTPPRGLPVEQPTTFELMVNLRTARELGITIPSSVLYRADRVVQ